MKIFSFDSEAGKKIESFESINLFLVPVLRGIGSDIQIVCMHLKKGGRIGMHQAASPQLFMVVDGNGWVIGEEDRKVPITQGQIAFWDKKEWHETITEEGLMAIVIEGENINPNQFLKEIRIDE